MSFVPFDYRRHQLKPGDRVRLKTITVTRASCLAVEGTFISNDRTLEEGAGGFPTLLIAEYEPASAPILSIQRAAR